MCGIERAKENIKKTLQKKERKFITNIKKTLEQFIKEANIKHNNKYDYSKVNYINNHTKICIICLEHGEFEMTPYNHLNGQECPVCSNKKRSNTKTKTTEQFIKEAKIIHCNFYSYDKTFYEKARKKVIITCPIHGDFEQTPDNHLKGCGCPKCQNSMLENSIRRLLIDNNIQFIEYYRPKWLKVDNIHSQSLDFYIPEYNVAIECQGRQHLFEYCGTFGSKTISSKELYKKVCEMDDRKYSLCKENNIKLLYFTKEKVKKYRYDIITDEIDLLNQILINIH